MTALSSSVSVPGLEVRPTVRERILGIDCGRFIAVIAVIFIHAKTSAPMSPIAESAARFAVPFFFMTAGFFMSHPGSSMLASVVQVCRRLLIPFYIWLFVYLCWLRPELAYFKSPKYLLSLIVRGGPAYNLWFLPSLAFCSVMMIAALRAKLTLPALIVLAGVLYALGLGLGAYSGPIMGRSHFLWETRDGPFFGFPFMVAGYVIARLRVSIGADLAAQIFLLGGVLQGLEIYALWRMGFESMHDQLIGTLPFGIGFFLLVRTIPQTPLALRMARFGRYSLGIFAVHLLLLQVLTEMAGRGLFLDLNSNLGELAGVALVGAVATALSVGAGQVKWLRPLVR